MLDPDKAYREIGREVLKILNEPGEFRDSIRLVIAALKASTGFDAVGIRLREGDDFPYSAQKGFSREFLSTEDTLIARDANGGACRDKDGRVRLACTCGMVLSGKTDRANPFLTPGGSFWTNDSSPLLDLAPGEDPRFRPRNECIHQGYASVALVPIRGKDGIVGMIHLNDRRKGCFTPDAIGIMEEIGTSIGAALTRKRLEATLRDSEAKYRGVFESGFDAVLFVDARTHRIESANAAALELYGYTQAELLSLKVEDLSADPGKTRKSVDRVSAGLSKGIVPGLRHRKKDGTIFPAEISTSRCTIDGRVKAVGAVRDITGRLHDMKVTAEAELLRERERITKDMIATVSHELRTPLAAIKGFAETLRRGGLEDEENRLDFVLTIERHTERLTLLVDDLLVMSDLDSRAKVPAFKILDLAGFVKECVRNLSPLIDAGRSPLAISVAPGLMVRADADRLARVFQNLLDNAFKYTRPGGRVKISARADEAGVVVTVRDTGRGMTKADLGRIFDRFYRGRATQHIHGTGLGLAIVKAIVDLHGGRVWAESVAGKGSAFHFTLPRA
ncbi:MAG: ATP-binding protein [Elusimicrobia bacterium]|nr:ATP-binding protein [Elusimicrobiota bacterium]